MDYSKVRKVHIQQNRSFHLQISMSAKGTQQSLRCQISSSSSHHATVVTKLQRPSMWRSTIIPSFARYHRLPPPPPELKTSVRDCHLLSSVRYYNSKSHNNSSSIKMQFSVHSTFRDMRGKQALPHGLEWNLAGESFVSYIPTTNNINVVNSSLDSPSPPAISMGDTPEVRRGILEAHNRWCFVKDLPFRTVEEIQQVTLPSMTTNDENNVDTTDIHYYVQWKEHPMSSNNSSTESRMQETANVIQNDPSAKGDHPPAEVWINGYFEGMLEPGTLANVLERVKETPSLNMSVKRCNDDNNNNLIRVERYFRGGLRHKQDIFDHMVDNLYAMEDVTIVEDNDSETEIIGTATLPDWIMGGDLSSRLYVRADKMDGSILFLRPLYHDDLATSDRKFLLKKGIDDDMISTVRQELDRLCYLAKLPLPFPEITGKKDFDGTTRVSEEKAAAMASTFTNRERQHRRNRRRFFGM